MAFKNKPSNNMHYKNKPSNNDIIKINHQTIWHYKNKNGIKKINQMTL